MEVSQTSDQLMLFAEASHSPARTSRSPERARALAASAAAYGRNTGDLLANYDRASSSWRTSQLCLDGDYQSYSETWPRSGTMRNGIAYQLPPLVPLTDATGFGLWQTPVSDDAVDRTVGKFNSRGEPKLSAEVKLWPTLRQIDGPKGARSPTEKTLKRAATGLANLSERVQLYPTPTAQDASNNGGASQYERNSLPLNAVIGGALNPTWVEWLMGFPIGWTDLEP